MKRSKKKTILSIVFLILNITLIAIIGIVELSKDGITSFDEIIGIWKENYIYLLLCLGAISLALIAESIKYYILIYKTTKQSKLWVSFKTAVMGKYYDNITPLGSGGQPFQIYYLTKSNIPVGIASSLPIVSFFLMQFAFLFLCLYVFIFQNSVLDNNTVKIAAYIGAVFSIFIPLFLLSFAIIPKTTNSILRFFLKILHKLHIVKDKDKYYSKITKGVNDYSKSIRTLSTSKRATLIAFPLSLIYQISLCSIPYFAIRACGVECSWIQTLSMCVFAYASISFIPTPGNSGAAEGAFFMIFASVMGENIIFFGMALWRFFSYFITLIFGLLMIFSDYISRKKENNISNEKINMTNQTQDEVD